MEETHIHSQFLREHGIRPSMQRLAVYDYIWRNHTHPTAENVYHALAPKISTLSRTTVYNTLRLFSERGVATMVTIEEKEMRFDAVTSVHGHFKCSQCGKLVDFPVNNTDVMSGLPEGCDISSTHFYVHGICPDCAKSGN